MKASETNTLKISLAVRAYQTPSSFHMAGRVRMQRTGSTSALKNEIAADTAPSFNAVKNDEAYMLNHITKNGMEHILNALAVSFKSSASYPIKRAEIGRARSIAAEHNSRNRKHNHALF